MALDEPAAHVRRRRYRGKNPRAFHDKYKELNPERYAAEIEKVRASGKTPAGAHLPIMEREVLDCLRPRAGEIAVDCTLGWGGHAQAILGRLRPGGRLIGIDVDPVELPRSEARLRAAGFGEDVFVARLGNFAGLPAALAAEGITRADVILADLGVVFLVFTLGLEFSLPRMIANARPPMAARAITAHTYLLTPSLVNRAITLIRPSSPVRRSPPEARFRALQARYSAEHLVRNGRTTTAG